MPRITDVEFDFEGLVWKVGFDVQFSAAEMTAREQLGLRYHAGVLIYERDDGRDEYVVTFNGTGMRWQVSADKNKDDHIETFDLQHIDPDDRRQIRLEFEEHSGGIRVESNQEREDRRHPEEYFPVIAVWNDLSPAFEFGPERSIERLP